MKFVLLVLIGALLWSNNDARNITADVLQDASEFVRPDPQLKISFWWKQQQQLIGFKLQQTRDIYLS